MTRAVRRGQVAASIAVVVLAWLVTVAVPAPSAAAAIQVPATSATPVESTEDPDTHHPEQAEQSDRSIGSWLLVAGALVLVVVTISGVFLFVRERDR